MKKKLYNIVIGATAFVAATLLTTTEISAQNINTIAGSGTTGGYTGDGTAASAATLNTPAGLTADASGNIYFADLSNGVVRKISTSGIITTVAGGGSSYPGDGAAATTAFFSSVVGVAVDGSGNLYIADFGHNRVRKVDASGTITTVAGTGTSGSSGDGSAATAAQLNGPYSVATDGTGNLYIADRYNHKIRKVNTSGIISTLAGDGVSGSTGDGGAATAARLNNPLGVSADAAGNVYVADYSNAKVRKINTSGTISTFAGTGTTGTIGDGGPAASAQLAGVITVCTDILGNVYLGSDATTGGNKVRIVNTSGIIAPFAGIGPAGFSGDGGGAAGAQFNNIKGVAADASGNVYISDAGNNRIRKVTAPNHVPAFTGGASQLLGTCKDASSVDINALLAVNDIDAAQSKTWSVLTAPAHGTIVAAYVTSSGSTSVVPTGLSYTPTAGYTGSDLFSVLINDGASSDTTEISVTVNATPTPSIVATGTALSTTTTYATYQWLLAGSPISGATAATYTATADGSYGVTVTDANTCSGSATPVSVSVTGINEPVKGSIRLYPNPSANGRFTVEFPGATGLHAGVAVADITGREIYRTQVLTTETLNLSLNFPAGIYYLSAITDNNVYQSKLVIE